MTLPRGARRLPSSLARINHEDPFDPIRRQIEGMVRR